MGQRLKERGDEGQAGERAAEQPRAGVNGGQAARPDRDALTPQTLLALQRMAGNRAAQQMLATRATDGALQRFQLFSKPASLTGISLNSGEMGPGAPVVGHTMDVKIDVDAGKKPGGEKYEADVKSRPHSFYGVSLEYWEQIDSAYDFDEPDATKVAGQKAAGAGGAAKPMSDIYVYNPGAMTFGHGDAGGTTWHAGLQGAKAGTLKGAQSLHVYDKPGLQGAKVKAGHYQKRTLKFLIVARDKHGARREILATQVVEIENGALTMSYSDSTGNSHVHGGGQVVAHDADFVGTEPQGLAGGVQAFKRQIQKGKAAAFVNRELDAIVTGSGVARPRDLSDLKVGTDLYIAYRSMNRSTVQMEGEAGVPIPRSGQKYKQYQLAGGATGLLVALVQGSKPIKLWYTTDQGAAGVDVYLKGKNVKFQARKFDELQL